MVQLRAHLIWAGQSPDDLDNMSNEDALACWELFQRGMAGPLVTYQSTYLLYAMLHNQMMGNVEKQKQKPPEDFNTVFPNVYAMMTLQDPAELQRKQQQLKQIADLEMAGAPRHLTDAMRQEFANGSTNT